MLKTQMLQYYRYTLQKTIPTLDSYDYHRKVSNRKKMKPYQRSFQMAVLNTDCYLSLEKENEAS